MYMLKVGKSVFRVNCISVLCFYHANQGNCCNKILIILVVLLNIVKYMTLYIKKCFFVLTLLHSLSLSLSSPSILQPSDQWATDGAEPSGW